MKLKVLIDGTWNEYEVEFCEGDEGSIIILSNSLKTDCGRYMKRWVESLGIALISEDGESSLFATYINDLEDDDVFGFQAILSPNEMITYTRRVN